jgi:hypothetical protein
VKSTHPPSLATKLLEALVPQRISEALVGDLIEQYERGRSGAWYWGQVLMTLLISASREVRTRKLLGCQRRPHRLPYDRVALLFLDNAGCAVRGGLHGLLGVFAARLFQRRCQWLDRASITSSADGGRVCWFLRRGECCGIRGVCLASHL